METKRIQIYASAINVIHEHGSINALLTGFDLSQIISEFNAEEVLDCIDLDTVKQYVTKKLEEDDE